MLLSRGSLVRIVLPVFLLGCDGCNFGLRPSAPPADSPASEVALAGAAVMIGVGDIADCGNRGDEGTARLADSLLRANIAAGVETGVFTLGDHAYPLASDNYLRRCFTPSWGDPAKQIMRVVRPSIGNHDYQVDRGAPYYRYFGAKAGPPFKGYYSYDIGEWHVIVLNSELARAGSAAEGEEQEAWLRKDLTDNKKLCTMSYFHSPLFSSAWRQGDPVMQPLWEILYAGDVDLVLNGHDHHYERFPPQNPAGEVDTLKGIPQYIVGTGGATLRGFRSRFGFRDLPAAANSAVRVQGHFGLLVVTLGASEYRTAFLDTDRRVWDRAGRKCH